MFRAVWRPHGAGYRVQSYRLSSDRLSLPRCATNPVVGPKSEQLIGNVKVGLNEAFPTLQQHAAETIQWQALELFLFQKRVQPLDHDADVLDLPHCRLVLIHRDELPGF